MGYHATAQVCVNGHVITGDISSGSKNFCPDCGKETVTACSSCSAGIQGISIDEDVFMIGFDYSPPAYCFNCGKPFPWTDTAINTAILLIQEEEEFSSQQKDELVEILPDVITETPKTNLAIVRVKKGLAAAGKFTAEGIRQFIIDFGCELAKNSLNL